MSLRSMSKLNVIFTLIAITCIVIMFLLGFWQLDRKSQKDQRLAQIESRQDAQALSLTDVIDSPYDYVDFAVRFSGKPKQALFYIDNRIKNSIAGYEILTPVKTDYGIVLINLGWVPGSGNRKELPRISSPKTSTFEGRMYIPSDNRMISETNFNYGAFPVLMQQIDFDEIQKHLGESVLPFTIRLKPEDNVGFVRDWQVVVMAPEKHLGYAIQWFGLGIAGLTVFLLTVLKSIQKPKEQYASKD